MNWAEVWRRKGMAAPERPAPSDLMALNGYDTGAGHAELAAMEQFAQSCRQRLKIGPDIQVLEVGCGAGAWLYQISGHCRGFAGVDISPGHLKVAHTLMPDGRFACADATGLPFAVETFDVAIAGACFLYLPDPLSAERAFSELVRVLKPGGRGAITDLPDIEKRVESERVRRGALEPGEYDRLYAGLEHQYYAREDMLGFAEDLGLRATIATQEIAGYGNSLYRFNVWLEKP